MSSAAMLASINNNNKITSGATNSAKRSSILCESILSKPLISKDIAMVKQVLNDSGKCSCVQILTADDNEFNLFVI